MARKKQKHNPVQIIKHNYDGELFDKNSTKYWIDKFLDWHKEIGRGAYVMETEGSGFCPLVPTVHKESGLVVSGSWSTFMDNINPLHQKVLEHYPTDRYGIFFDNSLYFNPTTTYFLELLPGLPDDLEVESSWHNSSVFLDFLDSLKRDFQKIS